MARPASIDWIKKEADPRQLPTYTISEAAHYLRIPRSTLHAWVAGQAYRTTGGSRLFRPVITLPDRRLGLLSFINLVEAHVLDAIRREHEVPLQAYLRRVEWDAAGVVARLYPFTRKRTPDEPKAVVIDPRISFGRPVLAGSGIPTAVIAERYKAGESIDELADDYGRERLAIEEAIRCELEETAA